ncbi:MAG TPA: hypothetical protein VEY71_00450, partial [Chitinophagales bacterium]|nr:hypothetical protein [Chitinophagales bacterium]
MSKYLFPFVLFFAALAASAQEDTHFKCGNVQWYNQNVLNNPQMLEAEEQYERETRDFLEQNPNPVRDGSDPDYIIPVVFHVVHDYGMENISDAQI